MKNKVNEITVPTQIFEKKNNKAILNLSIMEHRDRLAAAKPMLEPSHNVLFLDVLVPIDDDIKIPVRAYIPKGKKGALPTIFYIPGTAFIAAEVKFTHVICSHLCEMSGCQVIVINHRLAPENQFPKGYQDAYAVFKFFTVKMPEYYSIDRQHLAIAGYSSGGNFAATMSLQAQKEGIAIAQQILISPIIDLSRSLKGFEAYEKQDKAISEEFVNFFLNLYVPENKNLRDPVLSPFWVKDEEVKNLPRTAIILAKYDRFRSDAEYYYRKLKLAGVFVERFEAEAEDHSYLWYKLEVIEKVSNIVIAAFKPNSIEHISMPKYCLANIVPRLNAKENANDKADKEHAIPRAKL